MNTQKWSQRIGTSNATRFSAGRHISGNLTSMKGFYTLLLLLTLRTLAYAQSYSINWSTVDGGSGASTGGRFTLSGTIGQPDAGPKMRGGSYTLDGGFWGMFSVVQTPGAPRLALTRSGANIIFSWPSSASGYTLQSATDLNSKPVWTDVPQQQAVVGDKIMVTVPANKAREFFRLKGP